MPRIEVNQNLRIVFFGVLLLASAQVFWWIWDQTHHSNEELGRLTALYEADSQAAAELLQRGVSAAEVSTYFPHLEPVGMTAPVGASARDRLHQQRNSRINQYRWEGGFFLVVLLVMMWILQRTITAETNLRRRQEDFVAAVSHELKSPLASLQLTAETMERRDGDEFSRKRHLSRIRTDVQRLSKMISNILDSTKLARGDICLNPEAVRLQRAAQSEIENLGERAQVCGVKISSAIDADITVLADPSTVRVVLRNLLENALHATAAAGGGAVILRAANKEREVEMTVQDDGIGFPAEDSTHIFESFFRVGSELNRSTPGSGLGLAIVKRYLELDGARVRAASLGPGTGATFTVSWRRCLSISESSFK